MTSPAKVRDVLALLRDYRPFKTAYGGSGFINLEAQGQFGPAGYIYEGMAFDRTDRKLLGESIAHLDRQLSRLEKEHPVLHYALVEPYLSDTADPSVVDDWRRKGAASRERRREIARKLGAKLPVSEPERWAIRHDDAVTWLAQKLPGGLYVVHTRRMTQAEEKKVEDENAAIVRTYERTKRGGTSARASIEQVAHDYGISTDRVEAILEHRNSFRPDECIEENCERAPFSQHLCEKHYYRQYRDSRKKKG